MKKNICKWIYNYPKENIGWKKHKKTSQELRLKNKDGTRNYFNEKINQNELISKNHKNVCKTLNCI